MATFLLLAFIVATAEAGSLWPLPQNRTYSDSVLYLHPKKFRFTSEGHDSEILNDAFDRYTSLYFDSHLPSSLSDEVGQARVSELSGAIHTVSVYVNLNDQSLGLHTSEVYTLRVAAPTTVIQATTVFGALRALETLSQLLDPVRLDERSLAALPPDVVAALEEQQEKQELLEQAELKMEEADSMFESFGRHHHHRHHRRRHKHKTLFIVNKTSIYDAPRFKHRGLLLDTSRHWLPVSLIKSHLEAMSMSKLNVLHWHIVDDQSFPYQSERLPALSEYGAFIPGETVYTADDIEDILRYARVRGIRVIPELDTPGHTLSWGKGYPELLTECYDSHGELTGELGPLDVSKRETYSLLWLLIKEAGALFKDTFVHIGGDEVDEGCWKSNPGIKNWMSDEGMKKDVSLQHYHTLKMLDFVAAAGKRAIVWQEILDIVGKAALPPDVIVQVWKWPSGNAAAVADGNHEHEQHNKAQQNSTIGEIISNPGRSIQSVPQTQSSSLYDKEVDGPMHLTSDAWQDELKAVTSTHKALLSAPWYLDMSVSARDWEKLWSVDPIPFKASIEQVERVLGGEACMWAEGVDWTNSIAKTWPNAAAVAERLWSDGSVRDVESARSRLAEHRCRMLARGLPASPIAPGFCRGDPL